MNPTQSICAAKGEVIWKFELRPWSIFHDIPAGARVLSAGVQGSSIVAWAICDPGERKVRRLLSAVPTGEELPEPYDGARFVGTVQMNDGLVFHVWAGADCYGGI